MDVEGVFKDVGGISPHSNTSTGRQIATKSSHSLHHKYPSLGASGRLLDLVATLLRKKDQDASLKVDKWERGESYLCSRLIYPRIYTVLSTVQEQVMQAWQRANGKSDRSSIKRWVAPHRKVFFFLFCWIMCVAVSEMFTAICFWNREIKGWESAASKRLQKKLHVLTVACVLTYKDFKNIMWCFLAWLILKREIHTVSLAALPPWQHWQPCLLPGWSQSQERCCLWWQGLHTWGCRALHSDCGLQTAAAHLHTPFKMTSGMKTYLM